MAKSFSETEVSMAEASSNPETGHVPLVLILMFQVFYPGLEVLHHLN